MTATTSTQKQPETVYLENDGLIVSENTIKFQLIAKIQGGIDALFKDNENVFVAAKSRSTRSKIKRNEHQSR